MNINEVRRNHEISIAVATMNIDGVTINISDISTNIEEIHVNIHEATPENN